MATDVNWTYHGNHFLMYEIVQSLWCAPETNRIVCVNYPQLKKNMENMISEPEQEEMIPGSEELSLRYGQ